ncbi:MAG: methyltransferase domain-containing protein [Thermodesulfobacteriota bacterium]
MKLFFSPFHCRLCSFRGEAPVRYDYGKHKIYECPLCGVLFLHPRPDPEELAELYNGEQYFQHESFYSGANESIYGYPDYFAERMNKQQEYSVIAARCRTELADSPRAEAGLPLRLLEVGCGPGYFLSIAHNAGFSVRGIEFNRAIVENYGPRYPFPMEHCDFLEGECTPASYDCIVMLDVIEHFPDPFLALEKACLMLADGGLLVLSTVDSRGIGSRILGKRLEDFRRVREHLFFFNRSNMTNMLRNEGLARVSAESLGHTFVTTHLADRIRLMSPLWGRMADLGAGFLRKLGITTLDLDPRTKMIVYARKPSQKQMQATRENIAGDLSLMASYREYYDYYLSRVVRFFQGKRVMELGCGTGSAMRAMAGMGAGFLLGVDENKSSLEAARQTLTEQGAAPFSLVGADIEKERDRITALIRDQGIEVVFSFNFLEHMRDDMELLRSVRNALPPEGTLISILPAGSGLYNRYDEAYRHFRRYNAKDLDVRFAGYSCVEKLRVGALKAVGWKAAGQKEYRGLSSGLRWYHLLSRLDRMLDAAFRHRVPGGATWICVHRRG